MSWPLCCSTPGLPCSPGLPLDLQLSRDFATGSHWCLTPPYLSITPLAPLRTCSPEMPAFSAWHGSHNCFWPTSSPVQLYLELLKTPNYVFTTNISCRCPTSSLIRIRCHLPRGQPPSMWIIRFVILENVNKSVGLPIFFFLIDVSLTYNTQLFSLPVGKCRKKGRENACKPEPYQSPIRKSRKLNI